MYLLFLGNGESFTYNKVSCILLGSNSHWCTGVQGEKATYGSWVPEGIDSASYRLTASQLHMESQCNSVLQLKCVDHFLLSFCYHLVIFVFYFTIHPLFLFPLYVTFKYNWVFFGILFYLCSYHINYIYFMYLFYIIGILHLTHIDHF